MNARRRFSHRRRRGVALVEGAVVLSISILLMLGLLVAGLGVFRYLQLATLAREGARCASVYGGQYQQENTGKTAATPQDIYNKAILPIAVGLDTSQLSYTVTWDDPSKMPVYYNTKKSLWMTNNVTVTLTYQWIPEAYLGSIQLQSTSVMPVSY